MSDRRRSFIAGAASSASALFAALISGRVAGQTSAPAQESSGEIVSAKKLGAKVDGVSDDSDAIQRARRAVAAAGGAVTYGGKARASGKWENLTPLGQEWIKGLPSAYATDMVPNHPVVGGKLFNGTLQGGAGYAAYLTRYDAFTKAGVDVGSTVAGIFTMQSSSTNSSGKNFNNTNQVALVANASAMDEGSSASVEAINAIAATAYTGPLAQIVAGVEADLVLSGRGAGWYGEAGKNYGIGFSAVISGVSAGDGTVAFTCDSSHQQNTWLHGAVLSGTSKTGLTVARRQTMRPETAVWISAAKSFGLYVGSKPKHPLNPGRGADFSYRPEVGVCLGQEGQRNSPSHRIRFVSTDKMGAEVAVDVYANAAGAIVISFNGVEKVKIDPSSGAILVQDRQVLGARDTGWGQNSGATSKSGFNTETVTLQQLAQNVAALQQALKGHGLIGS
ncbi:hypothetical protein [Cupriavidus malaysiensis]|uniref:hypothetical protein n=1 Tax=Cupriavidus malaysiensis TaxID=367825 RepID=UPI0012FF86C0|nr:hypothetical protein [Cupriavidus malaysiensis]